MISIKYIKERLSDDFTHIASEKTGISEFKLKISCILNCVLGRCTLRDYFLYRFYYLNRRGKKEFISNTKMVEWNRKNSAKNCLGILDNKEKALSFFEEFVERDWCGVNYKNSEEQYETFCKRHNACILKPNFGTCGEGIQIIEDIRSFGGAKALREHCTKNNIIAEELIEQDERMCIINSSSVNTLRIGTLNGEIIGACVRFGRNNSKVDNFSSGGILANLDVKVGAINTVGRDQYGEVYTVHPDSKELIPGFKVPMWNECKEYVIKLAEKMREMPFVGWDVAIAQNGPTFIEANEASEIAVYQWADIHGIRREINFKI